MNMPRWQRLMRSFGLPDCEATFGELCKAYREPQRHYHTRAHIEDCLRQFDKLRGQAHEPEAIELALWFHDAVYRPYRSDNEQRSADWSARFLLGAGASSVLAERVSGLILATRHEAAVDDADTALLIDVDLSILGTDANRYALFERQVRLEYRWIPGIVYRRKRAHVLESFLARERIFSSELFYLSYERSARENMASAVSHLRRRNRQT